ncbi:MAG: hypothetical protein GC201_07165 [Alphaproteobacteria bacterium]|nr:hypothetical protein [Alphaproteobacteria bacterium]
MTALLLALAAAAAVQAPLRCGAVERPGIAERGADGVWRGAAVDYCRDVARREHGGDGATAFRAYASLDDLRGAARDDVAFLSDREVAAGGLSGALEPGPVIATNVQRLVVGTGSSVTAPAALAGKIVCFLAGSAAESALGDWAAASGASVVRLGFQEPVELRDGLDAGKCAAMAVDAADIPGGSRGTRPLGPPLAETPIRAMTPRDPHSGSGQR